MNDPLTPASPGFLEEVVRHVAHPIFVKDRAYRFVWVNDALEELTGLSRARLLGATDHDLFPREQADFFRLKDRAVIEQGETVTIEEEPITDAQQRVHRLATTKVPLRSPAGEITHLVGITHDISRLKATEEELRLANEGLERRVDERTRALKDAQSALLRKERMAVLGQLSGGVAHQIRTPLTTISNAAAVLRRALRGVLDDDARTAIDIITEEVFEANRIITDLLDFARMRPPTPGAVAVTALVDTALEAARPPSTIDVRSDIPDTLVVWVDERQARDAISNVIRNALEAMDEGGRLSVRADREGDMARIAIEDTGPGLRDEALAHLFEPLVTSKALGLGLGLPTARALIENQGGDLCYVKPSGDGARFEIRIPLAR